MKKLYTYSGKCDHQQQYKSILEESMVSTPYGITGNIPIPLITYVPLNSSNSRK